MIGVGPFSIHIIIAIAAVLVAYGAAALLAGKGQPATSRRAARAAILDAAFWGFLAARLGYVAIWWQEYAATPLAVIAIGDAGFTWWIGVPAAFAAAWWRTRSTPALRRPLQGGILAGVAAWLMAGALVDGTYRSAPPLPDVQLATLDTSPHAPSTSLHTYAGRPIVLNLWASWCPPCRREMPVFEQAQAQFPDIAFVMVNQGESAAQAQAFLEQEGLALTDVLLDPASRVMQAVRARGLPTTLFFDAQGRLVDSHMGELTTPSLHDTLRRRYDATPEPATGK